jgi:putative chitinase
MSKAMNRERFFLSVRMDPVLFRGTLPGPAVITMSEVINEWEWRKLTIIAWLAYMFATMRGEVGANMSPVREGYAQSDAAARAYINRVGYAYRVLVNGIMYYGRGLVQLTWHFNYVAMGKILGIDLEKNPDLALEPRIAVKIMFEGMIRGTFTGKKLSDYFSEQHSDWNNARRIINGTDKMAFFGDMGRRFNAAIVGSIEDAAIPPKAVINNVTSKERDVVKVGTGGAAVTTGVEATQGISPWIYAGVGALVLVAVIGIVLAVIKSRKFKAEWAKL